MEKFDIGILTFGDANTLPAKLYVDLQMKYFQNILMLSRAFGIRTAMFGLSDFQMENGEPVCSAMFWNGSDYVVERAVIPDIIDNVSSISNRWYAHISPEAAAWLRKQTPMHGRSLTKLQMYHALCQCGLSQFAIPTQEFSEYGELAAAMQGREKAIVKPSYGREGQGVTYIDNTDAGLIYRNEDGEGLLTEEAWRSFRSRWQQYKKYLLQERMDFHTRDGRAMDFRLLVLKGDGGAWTISSTHAKLGARKYISNVWNGGSLGYTKQVLAFEFPDKAEEFWETLNELGTLLPQVLERYCSDPVSSYGFDIGFDRQTERAYVIEANSFPGAVPPWPMAETRVRYYRYLLSQKKNNR